MPIVYNTGFEVLGKKGSESRRNKLKNFKEEKNLVK